jgi:hypothetical protein
LPVLLIGFSVALLWGWLLTYERHSPAVLFGTVVLVQVAVHGAAKLHGPGSGTSEHADHLASVATVEQGLLGSSPLAMAAVHAVATLVGVALLLRLERHAWRAARRVGLVVLGLLRGPRRRWRGSTAFRSTPSVRSHPAPKRWWAGVSACRGPPEACVGFR